MPKTDGKEISGKTVPTDVEAGTALSVSGEGEMTDISYAVMDEKALLEVDKMLSENDVVMFSKMTCPFCFGRL
jgi:hypothetical protein